MDCPIVKKNGLKGGCNIVAVKEFLEKKGIPCNNGAECILSWRRDIWPLISDYMDSNACCLRIPAEKERELFDALEAIIESPCSWFEDCSIYAGACKLADQIYCQPVKIKKQAVA